MNGWIVLDEDAAGNGDLQLSVMRMLFRRGWTDSQELFSANNKGEKMKNTVLWGFAVLNRTCMYSRIMEDIL